MKDYSLYIGIAAGICTAISLLPQLIKIIKEKDAGDISVFMLGILLLGLSGWLYYGILKKDYPMIMLFRFIYKKKG
jgi:MtN3 and saliva related transmembrane protein